MIINIVNLLLPRSCSIESIKVFELFNSFYSCVVHVISVAIFLAFVEVRQNLHISTLVLISIFDLIVFVQNTCSMVLMLTFLSMSSSYSIGELVLRSIVGVHLRIALTRIRLVERVESLAEVCMLLAHIENLTISTRSYMSLVLMPIRIIFCFVLLKRIHNLICVLCAVNLREKLLGIGSWNRLVQSHLMLIQQINRRAILIVLQTSISCCLLLRVSFFSGHATISLTIFIVDIRIDASQVRNRLELLKLLLLWLIVGGKLRVHRLVNVVSVRTLWR